MVKRPILLVVFVLAVGAGVGWTRIQPSNQRTWSVGQDRLPHAVVRGDSVFISELRNFNYDSAGQPIAQRYETRGYDLSQLETVWFVLAPFEPDNRGPAHSFLSFGFADSQFVAVSVEARREAGEEYSVVKGLLKRYELMYVIGDERDLIRLRVARGDDVYLYPIRTTPDKVRALFLRIIEHTNSLQVRPEFYNTLTNNCTTNILRHVNSVSSKQIRWGREVLLPGYADELAAKLGLLDTSLPIDEARRHFYINARALRAFDDAQFSLRIRQQDS